VLIKYSIPHYKKVKLALMNMFQDCRFEHLVRGFNFEFRGETSRKIFLEIVEKLYQYGDEELLTMLLENRKAAMMLVNKLKHTGMHNVDVRNLRDIIADLFLRAKLTKK